MPLDKGTANSRYGGRKTNLMKYQHTSEFGKRHKEEKDTQGGEHFGPEYDKYQFFHNTREIEIQKPYTGDKMGLFRPKVLMKYKWIPLILLGLFIAYQLYNDRSTPTVVLPFVNLPEQTHFSASTLNRN